MNRFSVYDYPSLIREHWISHFPSDSQIQYETLIPRLDKLITTATTTTISAATFTDVTFYGGLKPTEETILTTNGTYDITDYGSAIVNVPAPSGEALLTTNGTHSIVEYETAIVSVYPTEATTITANGDFDVAEYATATVSVYPTGVTLISNNGTFDVTDYSQATVTGIPQNNLITLTTDGTYNVQNYKQARVDVISHLQVLTCTSNTTYNTPCQRVIVNVPGPTGTTQTHIKVPLVNNYTRAVTLNVAQFSQIIIEVKVSN